VASGVATEEEVDIDTLADRLRADTGPIGRIAFWPTGSAPSRRSRSSGLPLRWVAVLRSDTEVGERWPVPGSARCRAACPDPRLRRRGSFVWATAWFRGPSSKRWRRLIARWTWGRPTPPSKGSLDIPSPGIRSRAASRLTPVERGPSASVSGRAATGSITLPDGSRRASAIATVRPQRQASADRPATRS